MDLVRLLAHREPTRRYRGQRLFPRLHRLVVAMVLFMELRLTQVDLVVETMLA